jgi:Protein of unknown function (DUF3501)
MKKIEVSEVLDLVAYERVRHAMRDRIIEKKKRRRIALGDDITLLFEDRDTVLFQIQEMVRTERIVQAAAIQAELDTYNGLVPDPGELSATLFIEIPDIARMSREELHEAVNRFQGLEQDCLRLRLGPHASPARFEAGRSQEEKMSAVHFLRFAVDRAAHQALAEGAPARLVVEHPRYRAEAEVPPPLRQELLADLA